MAVELQVVFGTPVDLILLFDLGSVHNQNDP
jgi:hypothetical protein